MDEIAAGKKDIQFVEVMACQGGCVNGGGQPVTTDKALAKNEGKDLI